MSIIKNSKIKNVVAIGNSVVDYLYEAGVTADNSGDASNVFSADEFLSTLPAYLPEGTLKAAPRSGDNILILKEEFEAAASGYLDTKFAPVLPGISAMERIFGKAFLAAGGSLANAVSAIASSKRNGQPIANINFLTVLDEGEAGLVFKTSMADGVVIGPVKGECLKVHVVPHQGDRIMVASPSRDNSTDFYNVAPHIADIVNADTDVVMFEGYLAYGPHFQAIADATLAAIASANLERAEGGLGPIQLVIAAAAQRICENDAFRAFFAQAVQTTNVTVHANTGEFRRLVNRDTDWRIKYDTENGDPFVGLDGSVLETKKRAAAGYRLAKSEANKDAIATAIQIAKTTPYSAQFVVTDGGNPAYVVSKFGYSTYAPQEMDISKIVNKVGAGDAFMGGYWAAQLAGFFEVQSMAGGNLFAQAAMMQQDARLSADMTYGKYEGPLSLLAQNGVIQALPKPAKTPALEIQ